MREASRKMAACGMMTALGVVLMLAGAVAEVGMYAVPMFLGLFLAPFGRRWGTGCQLLLWLAIGLLSLILVPDVEQDLMFLCFFGWYPALRPKLEPLPGALRLCAKLALFNGVVVALEAVIIRFFVPETGGRGLLLALLVLGNVTFLVYDLAIPRFCRRLDGWFRKLL